MGMFSGAADEYLSSATPKSGGMFSGAADEYLASSLPAALPGMAPGRAERLAEVRSRGGDYALNQVAESQKPPGLLKVAGDSIMRNTASAIKQVGSAVQMGANALGSTNIGYKSDFDMPLPPELAQYKPQESVGGPMGFVADKMAQPYIDMGGAIEKTLPITDPEIQKTFNPKSAKWWVDRGAGLVPQMTAQAALFYATGGASPAAQLFAWAAPAVIMEGGGAYEQAKARGASEDEAAFEGVAVAAGSALLESIGGGEIFARTPGLGKFFKEQVKNSIAKRGIQRVVAGGAEAATEAAQEAWSATVQYVQGNDKQAFAGMGDRLLAAGALGGGAGAVMSRPGDQDLGNRPQVDPNLRNKLLPATTPPPLPVQGAPGSQVVGKPEQIAPPPLPAQPRTREQDIDDVVDQFAQGLKRIMGGNANTAVDEISRDGMVQGTEQPIPQLPEIPMQARAQANRMKRKSLSQYDAQNQAVRDVERQAELSTPPMAQDLDVPSNQPWDQGFVAEDTGTIEDVPSGENFPTSPHSTAGRQPFAPKVLGVKRKSHKILKTFADVMNSLTRKEKGDKTDKRIRIPKSKLGELEYLFDGDSGKRLKNRWFKVFDDTVGGPNQKDFGGPSMKPKSGLKDLGMILEERYGATDIRDSEGNLDELQVAKWLNETDLWGRETLEWQLSKPERDAVEVEYEKLSNSVVPFEEYDSIMNDRRGGERDEFATVNDEDRPISDGDVIKIHGREFRAEVKDDRNDILLKSKDGHQISVAYGQEIRADENPYGPSAESLAEGYSGADPDAPEMPKGYQPKSKLGKSVKSGISTPSPASPTQPATSPVAAGGVATKQTPEQAKGPKPTGRKSANYTVNTEDNGDIGVQVIRSADGSVSISTDTDTIEYNAGFSKGKSDDDLLKYTFEPLGFNKVTPQPRVDGDLPSSAAGGGAPNQLPDAKPATIDEIRARGKKRAAELAAMEAENAAEETAPVIQESRTTQPETGAASGYSKAAMAESFNLSDEQAEMVDILVKSVGLDTSKLTVTKGGEAGPDALEQAYGHFEKKGFEETPEYKKLKASGHVVENFDIHTLAGKGVVIINPDNMITGDILNDVGDVVVSGNGGVHFVSKFGDVWATSNRSSASKHVNAINAVRKQNIERGGDGTVHVVLIKGSLQKTLNSHTGAKGTMSVLGELVRKKLIPLRDFRNALADAGKKHGINFDGRADAESIRADIEAKFFGVNDSTFNARGYFVTDVIKHLSKNSSVSSKNIEQIRDVLNSAEIGRKISFAHQGIADAIGSLFSDRMTVGVQDSHAYATIKVTDDVKMVEGGHESYPWHIKQVDGKRPTLHIINKPQHIKEIANPAEGMRGLGTDVTGLARASIKQSSEGSILAQGTKGAVEFADSGKALIRGFESADVSTAVHEIAHVIRRQLLSRDIPADQRAGISDEDIEITEKWAGVDDGAWTRDAEEKFARGFERYLRDGKSPSSELDGVFSKFAKWLTSIYKKIMGSDIDIEISPAMRGVFDNLLTRSKRLKDANANRGSETADAPKPVEAKPKTLDETLAQKKKDKAALEARLAEEEAKGAEPTPEPEPAPTTNQEPKSTKLVEPPPIPKTVPPPLPIGTNAGLDAEAMKRVPGTEKWTAAERITNAEQVEEARRRGLDDPAKLNALVDKAAARIEAGEPDGLDAADVAGIIRFGLAQNKIDREALVERGLTATGAEAVEINKKIEELDANFKKMKDFYQPSKTDTARKLQISNMDNFDATHAPSIEYELNRSDEAKAKARGKSLTDKEKANNKKSADRLAQRNKQAADKLADLEQHEAKANAESERIVDRREGRREINQGIKDGSLGVDEDLENPKKSRQQIVDEYLNLLEKGCPFRI